uniref:Uncharacterized protein n=1 Tax=Attheya septentrionalis TaxID=420275 RepID=A0A7S2XKZ2_9STRA|mmetsp:Transcript_17667/g.31912  ORF Transcript_17667/g.31912 Transcript_17667/m.31912 type:complete len:226 (+) Transcript_17667:52-729(+)
MKHVHDTEKGMVVPLHYYCSRRSSNWRRQTAEERSSVIQNKNEDEDEYESAMAFLREFHNKNEVDENDHLLSRASTHTTLCSIPEESSSLSDDESCLDSYYHRGSCIKKSDTCQSFEQFVSSPVMANDFDDDDQQQQQESSSLFVLPQHDLDPFSNTQWGYFDPSEDTSCGSSKRKSPPSKAVTNDDMSSSWQGHAKRPEPRRRPVSKWRFSFRSIRTTLFIQCI